MRKAIFTLLFMMSSPFIFAQEQDPVHWQFKAEKIKDNIYELHFTAYVNPPYHIYSQDNSSDMAIPTTLEFSRNPLIELNGKPKETGELETESISGATLKYYENRVEFVQTIKLKAAVKVSISGKINYMACTDGHCLPPTEHRFAFSL